MRAFALPIPDIQWLVIAYTLTYAALMLVFGRLGDMVGHRNVFLTGAALSVTAYVLCAISTDYGFLLAARVLQGIGAALTLSCGPALITSLYAEERRAAMLSLYTLLGGVGGALGPIIGGLLVEQFGWAAVFAFRAPIALLGFAAGWTLLAGSRGLVRERFDGVGALLLVTAIAALLLALNQLQQTGWLLALVLFAVALFLAIAFVRQERRVSHPIIDVKYFRDPDFALLNFGQVLLSLAGFSIFLLAPFYLATVGGLSAPIAGFVLAAAPLGTILSAPIASRLARALHARRLALIGAAASALALLVISILVTQLNLAVFILAATLQGLGTGLFQIAYFDIATATLPKENRGVAGSLVLMTRTIGLVMGASLLMLAFRALSGASAAPAHAAQLAGFSGAFAIAGLISLSIVLLALARGWAGREAKTGW